MSAPVSSPQSVRLVRHRWPDRLYHWFTASAVLILLGTAFLPIVGIKFAWVDAHWITGLVLGGLVLIHILRATLWLDFWSMMIGPRDALDVWRKLVATLRRSDDAPLPGKYPLPQKLYHALIAVAILSLIATGVMMMVKIDTPLWARNPYWLSAATWGVVYVLHDLAAMIVLAVVIVHIYFALRPEKLWITRSMILGWITPADYAAHHDPARWAPETKGRK